MDEGGIPRFHQLEEANPGHRLAVVLEGAGGCRCPLSVPPSGKGGPIIGRFTAEEINRIKVALKTAVYGPSRSLTGKFVLPADHDGRISKGYLNLSPWHPQPPKPPNFDQMTDLEQRSGTISGSSPWRSRPPAGA